MLLSSESGFSGLKDSLNSTINLENPDSEQTPVLIINCSADAASLG